MYIKFIGGGTGILIRAEAHAKIWLRKMKKTVCICSD